MSQKLRIPYQKNGTIVNNGTLTLNATIPSGASCTADIRLTGHITLSIGGGGGYSFGDTFGYSSKAVAKNVSGTATLVGNGNINSYFNGNMSTCSASVSVSGTSLTVTATGPTPDGGTLQSEWIIWVDLIIN